MSGKQSIVADFDLRVPLSDGTGLVADLYRPARAGPAPTVLLRTPYDRTMASSTGQQVGATRLASHGYAVLIQDVRGRHGSEGDFTPFLNEGRDGLDTINWIAEQSWSNGHVGTVGTSYAGYAQVLGASKQPENLKAWVPALTLLDAREHWAYQGDAFCLGFNLSWTLAVILPQDRRLHDLSEVISALENWPMTIKTSVADLTVLNQPAARWFLDWIHHRNSEDFWSDRTGYGVSECTAPSLQIAGWFDLFEIGSFALHDELKTGVAGDQHRLVIGPWDHSGLPLGTGSGDSDFGPSAALDLFGVQRAWFDWLLCEESEPDFPAVRAFLTGRNRWESFACWPPPAEEIHFFLAPDGALSEAPSGGDGLIKFLVDPHNPTPTVGGRLCCVPYLMRPGQLLQDRRSRRADVIRFSTTPALCERAFLGPVTAQIHSSSNYPVADVHATLVDIAPDGCELYLADSIRRLEVTPGEMTRFDVDLGHIGHLLQPGHRVALDIAGASFPRFDLANPTSNSERSVAFGGSLLSFLTLHEAT